MLCDQGLVSVIRWFRTFGSLSALLAAVLIVAAGCDDEKKVTPPDNSPYLDQSSAVNVLENLKTAYELKQYPQYEKLFAADFIFVFHPSDVGDPENPTPQAWQRADEMSSAQYLFTSNRVDGITLNWTIGSLVADDTYPTHDWKIRVDNVQLDVQTRNEVGEVWIFQVNGATHVYYFREATDERASDGRAKWYCTRWDDSPIGFARSGDGAFGPAIVDMSWGRIKARFR